MSVWVAQPLAQRRGKRATNVTTKKLPTGQFALQILAVQHEKVRTPVLLPATLGRFMAQGQFLAISDGRKPFRRDAEGDQIIACGLRPFSAKGQVVLGSATLITMALDLNLRLGVTFQPIAVRTQDITRFRRQFKGIIGEMGILEGTAFPLAPNASLSDFALGWRDVSLSQS